MHTGSHYIGCPGCNCTACNRQRAAVGKIYKEQAAGRRECNTGAWSDAGNGACSQHGGLKLAHCQPVRNAAGDCYALWLPVDQLHTDTARFQNREGNYSQESVDKIVRNFDERKLDPITVWQDPATGKTYVLSGHSRYEAHKLLNRPRIPARIFQGTEAEAIRYGRVDANRSGTAETLKEDIAAYRLDRDGDFARGIAPLAKGELREKWAKKYNALEAFSFMNPSGKFLEVLGTPAEKSFPYIEQKAGWVGNLRRQYPALTNAHEGEMFDFLIMHPEGAKMRKDDFFARFSSVVDRLDWNPEQPLRLDRSGARGSEARADTGPAAARLREIERELNQIRTSIRTAGHTPQARSEMQKFAVRLLEEKERIERGITTAIKSQTALFGIRNCHTY